MVRRWSLTGHFLILYYPAAAGPAPAGPRGDRPAAARGVAGRCAAAAQLPAPGRHRRPAAGKRLRGEALLKTLVFVDCKERVETPYWMVGSRTETELKARVGLWCRRRLFRLGSARALEHTAGRWRGVASRTCVAAKDRVPWATLG
jgi:hypothetical protein